MELPKRKAARLKNYDYSSPGAYFITICTHEKAPILSRILPGNGIEPPESILTECGAIVQEQIISLASRYTNIHLDKYVIMPNHIHILFSVAPANQGDYSASSVTDAACALKSLCAIECKKRYHLETLWQRSFHDHVIRDKADYLRIWQYIDGNPAKWTEDCFYIS